MRPMNSHGYPISWDEALSYRFDYEAVDAAASGRPWAAWLLELLEAEDAGEDVSVYQSWRDFENRDDVPDYEDEGMDFEDYYDDWLDIGDEIEVTADNEYEAGR